MNISSFDDLLQAAMQQAQPQRLLFVFASADLPADSTEEQRARFQAGEGGALVPVMCVDKAPDELKNLARQGNLWVDMDSFGTLVGNLQGTGYRARHGQVT
jgi:hypothetical protein